MFEMLKFNGKSLFRFIILMMVISSEYYLTCYAKNQSKDTPLAKYKKMKEEEKARERNRTEPYRDAFVTYVGNDNYILGARVLGKSLEKTGTKIDRVVMITKLVGEEGRMLLANDGWKVVLVDILPNPWLTEKAQKTALLETAFTKLQIWNLTQYDRVVYFDADVLVVKPVDHLLGCGNGMCGNMGGGMYHLFNFNAGVMVIRPSQEVFTELVYEFPPILKSSAKLDEASYLNKYFMHWCLGNGKPLHGRKKFQESVEAFVPPLYDRRNAKFKQKWMNPMLDDSYVPPAWMQTKCLALANIYNWRWALNFIGKPNTLIGESRVKTEFFNGIEVVHYAGSLKPWDWKLYPFHGWIQVWQGYAAEIGDFYSYEPLDFIIVYLPKVFALALLFLASKGHLASFLLSRKWLKWVERLQGYITFDIKHQPKLFYIQLSLSFLFTNAIGIIGVLAPPYALWENDFLPKVMSAISGWSLYFQWCILGCMLVYGPLGIWYYQLGHIDRGKKIHNREFKSWILHCFPYIRNLWKLICITCLLYVLIMASVLGYIAYFLAWKSAKDRLNAIYLGVGLMAIFQLLWMNSFLTAIYDLTVCWGSKSDYKQPLKDM